MKENKKEEWRNIAGYEGLYQVSNLGNVKSLNYNHTGKEQILKPKKTRDGYFCVNLYKNRDRKMFTLHRLVATAFLPNTYNLAQVNHKDENKLNNKVDNLEWCNNQYNIRYSQAKKVGCYKDGKLIKMYETIIDVKQDGFNDVTVCQCCQEKGYKSHHGFQWQYI